jgi:hypothetical protein
MAALELLVDDWTVWAEELYKIRVQGGRLEPLIAKAVQRAIYEEELRQIREKGQAEIFCLKARRAGVSTAEQSKSLHQAWRQPYFDCITLAHTGGAAYELFEITRRAVRAFPGALLPDTGDKDTYQVSFPRMDSNFFTGTAGSKKGVGRGATLKRAHLSEFAHYEDPIGTLGSLLPALEGVPESVVVLETTATGSETPAHVYWQEAVDGKNGYAPMFFPWWVCDPVKYRRPLLAPDELGALTEEEKLLIAAHGLDLEQIKWRRAMIGKMHRDMFLTEYAESSEGCWTAPGGMFFEHDLVTKLLHLAPEPRAVLLNGSLELYDERPESESVVIGCDTAEGSRDGRGDRSAWVARAVPSGRLLATFADSAITPGDLGDLLSTWGTKFSHNGMPAFLVIEKNAHGITVLRKLLTLDYPARSIYHRTPLDRERDEKTERIGWATTAESKPLMLGAGRELLAAAAEGFTGTPSAAALRDAFRVRKDEHGRVDLNGRDVLVAEMLAWIGRTAIPAPGELRVTRAR